MGINPNTELMARLGTAGKQVAIRDQAAHLYHIEAIMACSPLSQTGSVIRWPGYLLLTRVITSYSASA